MPIKRYFLKGIDYFQLLIDHHNKRLGGPGHEARLAIFLEGKLDENKFRKIVSENEICIQLQTLHVSKSSGLGFPSLVFSDVKQEIPVSFHTVSGNTIPNAFLNTPVDVYHRPPLHIQIIYFENRTTCVLFTFHHIVFDFAGVQSFINSISGIKNVPLLPPELVSAPFVLRFKRFFRAVFFTFREANRFMTIPERKLPVTKPLKIIYKELEFSDDETVSIYENSRSRGLQLNRSIFFVACICKVLHDEIFSKQRENNFIWIPVPVNFRKKGTTAAVLLNGLSFLFYKVKPGQLGNLDEIISELQSQMKDQMRKELPQAFLDFADGYWYMPLPFYYPMMNLPSWGKLSSFSFSTLGNTFSGMKDFSGLPVSGIKNYPSNPVAPGFTFLFYEFRGRLSLMTSWVEGQYTEAEQNNVLEKVKKLVLS